MLLRIQIRYQNYNLLIIVFHLIPESVSKKCFHWVATSPKNRIQTYKYRATHVCLQGYRFYERNTRMGFNSKSRFGLALSGLGDINRDGYGGKSCAAVICVYYYAKILKLKRLRHYHLLHILIITLKTTFNTRINNKKVILENNVHDFNINNIIKGLFAHFMFHI